MKNYYYVHTGHRIGLDRFRRACAVVRELQKQDVEITLLCSDFRIANERDSFGIIDTVGVDVVRNIPQISHHGDNLIFDSDEANPIMLEDMKNYFTKFTQIKKEEVIVDEVYFRDYEKTIELSFFFGDDDYEKDLENYIEELKKLNPVLLLGFYYFLDYEDMLKENFPNYYESEDYDEVITKSKVLITSSPQAVLESIASGGKPIYFKRDDYGDEYDKVMTNYNVPIIKTLDAGQINMILSKISNHSYHIVKKNSLNFLSFIIT